MVFSVVSLFSGLGGLDLGFMWEGYKVAWANDLSDLAAASYQLNFGHPVVRGDITRIPLEDIPDADVVIGGPPCQSFSLMGRRWSDDPRGRLVFRFLDVVRAKSPRAFVMENVPGITASRVNGRGLVDLLCEEMSLMGYRVSRMALIATDYLVPQRRRRLFLVGCRAATLSKPDPVAFAEECYSINVGDYEASARAAIADLGPCTAKGARASYRGEGSTFAQIMRAGGLSDVSLHECPRMSETDLRLVTVLPPGGTYRDIPDEIAPGRVLTYKQTGGRTTTYGRLHPDRPAYTINTYFRRPNVGCNFHYSEPRLITPREAMRFQAIPDHFEIPGGAQDQRNALIGNAVPPLVGRAVAWALKKALKDEGRSSQPNGWDVRPSEGRDSPARPPLRRPRRSGKGSGQEDISRQLDLAE